MPKPADSPAPKTEAVTLEGLQALLKTVLDKQDKLETDHRSGLTGLRSMYDRQIATLRGQIAQAGGTTGTYDRPYDRGTDAERTDTRDERDATMEETDRFERERDRFERNHPQYSSNPELRKRVDAILNDPAKRDAILSHRADQRIDYARSYRTAYLEARDQIAIEAEAAAATARTQADEQKRDAKTNATLSGDVVEELPEGLTLDAILDMDADEMVEKGLVPGLKTHKPIVGV